MSFTNLALGLMFAGAAASMLFVAWLALILGQQTAWGWLARKLGVRSGAMAVRW